MSGLNRAASVKSSPAGSGGFTLLELLVATMMFAIVVGALYSVSHGALNMREKAYNTFQKELPIRYAASVIRRDLESAVVPSGILAGPALGEKSQDGGNRLDSLEVYSSSGVVDDDYPWGDIQKVKYSLVDPADVAEDAGKDLVRTVSRNLLYEDEQDADEQHLLGGAESLEFAYYDGEVWRDAWDSTVEENALPLAVRVLIKFGDMGPDEAPKPTMEMVVPIVAKAPSTTQQESTGTRTGGPSEGSGGTQKGSSG